MEDWYAPVSTQRTSEKVAAAIQRVILSGKLQPGDTLPPERSLAQRFQVTRNTVREALRRLEQLRLVRVRQGSGIRVRDYLSQAGLELLADLLEGEGGTGLMQDIGEARSVVGLAMACHAIDRIEESKLPAVAAAVLAFEEAAGGEQPDLGLLQELDFEVHHQLLCAAGNRALVLLHNSIRHVYRQVAELFQPLFGSPGVVAAHHRELLAALVAGDRARAKAVMAVYFEAGRLVLAAGDER